MLFFYSCDQKCPYSEQFWSTFSRIWTRITPNTDTFYAVDTKLVLILNSSRHYLVMIRSRNSPKLVTEIISKVLTRLCFRLRVMWQVLHLSKILVDRQFVTRNLMMCYVFSSLFVSLLDFLYKLWCSLYVLDRFVCD